MTRQSVTDEQYGWLCRRVDELKRRVRDGTLLFELTMEALQDLIEGKGQTFQTLKTIKLGTGLKNKEDFLKALEERGYRVSDWAKNILFQPAFKAAERETKIDLVVVSGRDLGFQKPAPRSRIYRKAQQLGLELCPAEAGPQLRIQYPDQPDGELLLIAMEPIIVSGGDLSVFEVEHDSNGRWLYGYCGDPDCVWSPGNRWVFCRK